jgi:hypothetical protein
MDHNVKEGDRPRLQRVRYGIAAALFLGIKDRYVGKRESCNICRVAVLTSRS